VELRSLPVADDMSLSRPIVGCGRCGMPPRPTVIGGYVATVITDEDVDLWHYNKRILLTEYLVVGAFNHFTAYPCSH